MAQTTLLTLIATLAGGAAAGAGASLYLNSQNEPAAEEVGLAPDGLAELRAEIQELRAMQGMGTNLGHASESSLVAPARRAAGGEELEEMVARLVAEALEGKTGAAPGEATELDGLDVNELYAKLQDPSLSYEDREFLWQAIRDAGRSEELVELLEARFATDPNNPELAVELGKGYLQRIQEVGNGPLAGVLATQADNSFNKALELNPQHWDARFNKAVALSFWPPVMGKQRSAIAEFETLVAQQSGAAAHPGHAQTHLLLGNMYQQIGETDKAIAAWSLGAQLFPDDPQLAGQLQLGQDANNQ